MTHSQNNTFHCLDLPICVFNLCNSRMLNFNGSENDLKDFNSFSEQAIAGNVTISNVLLF